MQKLNIKSLLLALFLALFVAAPVFAVEGSSGSRESGDTSPETSVANDEDTTDGETRQTNITERESFRERKAALLERVQQRRAEIKQDVCERRQAHLASAVAHLSKSSTVLKERIDRMYDKVVGFYQKGQLTVDNYDSYIAKIDTAKAAAAESVSLIDQQSFTVDCATQGVGQQLDGFRLAVQEARTPLKEYRKALVDLIRAMKSAAAQHDTTDTTKTEDSND